jgi:hypothetical protein
MVIRATLYPADVYNQANALRNSLTLSERTLLTTCHYLQRRRRRALMEQTAPSKRARVTGRDRLGVLTERSGFEPNSSNIGSVRIIICCIMSVARHRSGTVARSTQTPKGPLELSLRQ